MVVVAEPGNVYFGFQGEEKRLAVRQRNGTFKAKSYPFNLITSSKGSNRPFTEQSGVDLGLVTGSKEFA